MDESHLRDRLVAAFQPIVELPGGRVVGHEALARVRDGDGSLRPPEDWLAAVSQDAPLLMTLTVGMVQRVVAALDRLPGYVTVNIPVALLGRLGPHLAGLELGRAPSRVVAELSERGQAEEIQMAAVVRARALGMGVALDDVGGGSARLALLALPIDIVKLDRPFALAAAQGGRLATVVQAVVALGQRLGFVVVAEGIETRQQSDALARLGVQYGQGFLFGGAKPLD